MASSKKFWIFSDAYCFFGFITQILYSFVPILFIIQLKNNMLKKERLSCIALISLYANAFIYFWVSIYRISEDGEIDSLDFANMTGWYLGLIYVIIYFYYYFFKENKLKFFIYISVLVLVSLGVFLIICFTIKPEDNIARKIFNWLGIIFNILENLPMGFNIVYLIKNKVSEKYTLFGAFFGLINSIAWLAWAIHATFVDHDSLEHSIVANCLIICLHILQFTLFFIFRKGDDSEDNEEVIDETKNVEENIIQNTGLFNNENQNNNNLNNNDNIKIENEETKENEFTNDMNEYI